MWKSVLGVLMSWASWETILKWVLKFGVNKLSGYLGEVQLSGKAIMMVQCVYTIAATLGTVWAAETKSTDIDDELVNHVIGISKSLEDKHGFSLPVFK